MKTLGGVSQLRTGFADVLERTWAEIRSDSNETPSLFLNSMALILARVSSSGLGFLTWLIAARLYATAEVGVASGLVSAMMLCVQLALLGIGSAVIKLYPHHAGSSRNLFNTSFTVVLSAAVVGSGLFLLLASALFRELDIVGDSVLYSLLFVGITTFGTLNVLFDHLSIALQRGMQVLSRNILFGVVAIVLVGVMPSVFDSESSMAIIFAWVMAGLSACALGTYQLLQTVPDHQYRPNVDRPLARNLLRVGVPNYILTLTERAPAWLLPILVTELLTPTDNAHWYTVWMMAWVVLIVPISVGQNLFAAIARDPDSLGSVLRQSIRSSLMIGGVGVIGIMIIAPFILGLMGKGYADAGIVPLRILSLTLFPVTFIQAYYGMCRGFQRLNEASWFGMLNGLLAVTVTIWAGVEHGLTGMAVAWLGVQTVTSVWALIRLRMLTAAPSAEAPAAVAS